VRTPESAGAASVVCPLGKPNLLEDHTGTSPAVSPLDMLSGQYLNDLKQNIVAGLEVLGQTLPAAAVEKLARVIAELERWNRRINLTAIRDPQEMVSGHILDSLSLRPLLEGASIADIGTGAGFPGLPLAIAEPDRRFLLLDGNGRKIAFVKHMIADLGLGNASAVQSRAENFAADEAFDTVVARALATLDRIVELSAHLVAENGVLLAQKGQYPAAELETFKQRPGNWNFRVIELQVPGLPQHSRHVVRLTRAESA
jgi:16S rRNA (guanine527-N7)-methyltransferase